MQKKKLRKLHVTLLEVLVAMMLLSGLLVIIFGFFRELSVLNQETKKTLQASFQRRYAESRLSYVFSHLINENLKGKKFYFFTIRDDESKFPSLIFSFYNGDALDPHVSADVLGRLFVDQGKRLCLAIWPLKEEQGDWQTHAKIECLVEDVEHLAFLFLSAPGIDKVVETDPKDDSQPSSKKEKQKKEPPKGQWVAEWDKDYKEMPVIVKIDMNSPLESSPNEDKATLIQKIFAFVLPSSKHPIKFITK